MFMAFTTLCYHIVTLNKLMHQTSRLMTQNSCDFQLLSLKATSRMWKCLLKGEKQILK